MCVVCGVGGAYLGPGRAVVLGCWVAGGGFGYGNGGGRSKLAHSECGNFENSHTPSVGILVIWRYLVAFGLRWAVAWGVFGGYGGIFVLVGCVSGGLLSIIAIIFAKCKKH